MPQAPLNAFVAKNPSNVLVALKVDANGDLIVSSAGTPGNSSKNYAANTAGDQAKLGAGILRGLTVNTAGLTSTATLYDGTSTSGTKLGTFSTLAQNSLQDLNLAFATGLFVVLAGGTPADVTVSWS